MAEETLELIGEEMVENGIENQYLNFRVDNAVYGVGIQYVLQIVGMQGISEMPEMPPYMKGFIYLRGNAIPVYSVRLRFGKEEEEYSDRTCIIVIQLDDKEMGLIVDSIEETVTIDPQHVSPQTSVGTDYSYITGIARMTDDQSVILVDIEALFLQDQL